MAGQILPQRHRNRPFTAFLLLAGILLSVSGTAAATPLLCLWFCKEPTTTVTTPSHTSITLGDTVSDTANVTPTDPNKPGPVTGNVEFFVCSPDFAPCTVGGYDIGSFALSSGQANSGEIRPSLVGLYCFRAEYQGTRYWAASQEDGEAECVDVLAPKAETNTTTTPSHTSINLGDTVSDTATVTPADPNVQGPVTGSVEFFVCSPDSVPCPTGGYDMGSFPLVDGQANTGEIRPGLPGDYCFRAEFPGNGSWQPSQEDGKGECVNVMAPTNTTTTPSHALVFAFLGQSVNDTATVTSTDPNVQGPVSGDVKFFLCAKDVVPCATGGDPVPGGPLANGQATSGDVTLTEAGTYCFRAEYGGEVGWAPSQDGSAGECFQVVDKQAREPSQTVTTPSTTEAGVGDQVTDSAHVSAADHGEGNTAGNVTFYVCGVGVVPCTSGGTLLGTVPLDQNGDATSPPFQPTAPGTYCFRGEFSGNREYEPSMDASKGECFTVKAQIPFFPSTGALLLGILGSLGGAGVLLKRRR